MRRILVILATVLALIAASCGSDTVATVDEETPTAPPAPTIEGVVVEIPTPESTFEAETVLIGIPADQAIEVRALPGLEQPLAGDVAAGTSIEPMGEAFETDDGLTWWRVRAGDVQGWIQPNVAYRGPAEDVSEQVLQRVADQSYPTAEEAALAVAGPVATQQGASDTIVVSRTDIESQGSASITVDVLGLGDDSVAGYRLIVAAQSASRDGGAIWEPVSVTQLVLCSRGVSPEGLCL